MALPFPELSGEYCLLVFCVLKSSVCPAPLLSLEIPFPWLDGRAGTG